MKRVLIFSLTYEPFIGGAEVAVREITNRINSADIEFDMVTLRFDRRLPKQEKVRNISVYRIGFSSHSPSPNDLIRLPLILNKYLFPFAAFLKGNALQSKNGYDAVWSIMANYAGFAALFFKLFNPSIPFILTLQEGDPISHIKRKVALVYPLFITIFKKADFVQAISKYLAIFSRSMGFGGPLEIIPNGVDVQKFSKEFLPNGLDELKLKLGKKIEDILLITTSRLVKKNGIADVIEAMKFLPENIKFLIIGDGPERLQLKNLTYHKGLSAQVKFLGHLSHEEIVKYLKVADIFIRPSHSEGMGNSFIEAMASGVPVIGTNVGGIPDFLSDPLRQPGVPPTGRMAEVGDPKDIAETIKKYTEDKEVTETIIKNAKNLVFKKYDWSLITKQMTEKVFDRVLKKR